MQLYDVLSHFGEFCSFDASVISRFTRDKKSEHPVAYRKAYIAPMRSGLDILICLVHLVYFETYLLVV